MPRPDAASPVRPLAAARHREAPADRLPTLRETRGGRSAAAPRPGVRPREAAAAAAEPIPSAAAVVPAARPDPDADGGVRPRPERSGSSTIPARTSTGGTGGCRPGSSCRACSSASSAVWWPSPASGTRW
ncbi:IgG-binding virulence factor TspB family protein [Streptomyces sp. NPDC048106]|uniref:IgG-binding virulence factor TspB family protein n=1 Tax=Streptomyces sp. NPDC048106 TaxID=3155750 RepID=UPI003456A0D1